jgi:hypothetical protein
VTEKEPARPTSAAQRRRERDRRVAALSLHHLPAENQRTTRALNQALLAGELHDAIFLCLLNTLVMPVAALLRSLVDTSVLGIWLVRYATDEEARDSVANLSTLEMVEKIFGEDDKKMFLFLFEPVKGTDHLFYRDVLHPSIHGDALHIAMRIRDGASKKTWIHKCVFHTNQVYVHLLLQFAKSGKVPKEWHDYVRDESVKSIRSMDALLKHPEFLGTDEHLSE